MIDLGLLFLIVWMLKNAAVDVSCAIQGTENPRYALKRQQALAAGKAAPKQPRYGGKEWAADLLSDGLAAQTERRRAKAAKKAEIKAKEEKPLDDLAEAVREEPVRPAPVKVRTDDFPEFRQGEQPAGVQSSVVHDDHLDYIPGPHQLDPEYKGGPVSHVTCGGCGQKCPLEVMTSVGDKPACPACAPGLRRKAETQVPPEVLATARTALVERDPHGHRRLAAMDDVWGKVEKAHPGVDPTVIDQAVHLADRTVTPKADPYWAAEQKTDQARVDVADNEKHTYRFDFSDRGVDPLTTTCTRDDLAFVIGDHLDPGGNFDFDVLVSEDGRTAAIQNHGEDPHSTVRITRTDEPKDTRPDAVIYQFPNPKKIEKEITMATSEVTGLSTAMAFAETAASAHASFATGGTEGYTGALAQHGVGDNCISSAREAQEASSIAAAKWAKHHEDLAAQLNVKEAYQGTPDAGNKQFLLNG